MKRVMILGQPGSGKSTLARALGACTGLPVHHMDHIHWLPGWTPRPLQEKIAMAHAIENGDVWIFEGGLSATYRNRIERADTLVFLDIGLPLRLWRVTWRFVRDYGRVRPDMADGCPEGNWGEISDFYRYIWRTRHSARARILSLIAGAPSGLSVHILRSRADAARFLETADA